MAPIEASAAPAAAKPKADDKGQDAAKTSEAEVEAE
jgi:hypothetical protein